jgi:hypothetical protein
MHVVIPFGFEQTVPQPPQLLRSFCLFTSQPLAAIPSQSAKVPVQLWTAHCWLMQLSFAFGKLHAKPHPPQFCTVVMLVSQPLLGFPSQSDHPVEQVGTHWLLEQIVEPCAFVQPAPQAPQ